MKNNSKKQKTDFSIYSKNSKPISIDNWWYELCSIVDKEWEKSRMWSIRNFIIWIVLLMLASLPWNKFYIKLFSLSGLLHMLWTFTSFLGLGLYRFVRKKYYDNKSYPYTTIIKNKIESYYNIMILNIKNFFVERRVLIFLFFIFLIALFYITFIKYSRPEYDLFIISQEFRAEFSQFLIGLIVVITVAIITDSFETFITMLVISCTACYAIANILHSFIEFLFRMVLVYENLYSNEVVNVSFFKKNLAFLYLIMAFSAYAFKQLISVTIMRSLSIIHVKWKLFSINFVLVAAMLASATHSYSTCYYKYYTQKNIQEKVEKSDMQEGLEIVDILFSSMILVIYTLSFAISSYQTTRDYNKGLEEYMSLQAKRRPLRKQKLL